MFMSILYNNTQHRECISCICSDELFSDELFSDELFYQCKIEMLF